MSIITVDPAFIDPNPYQPATRLTFTPADLADLESILTVGFLQTPQARVNPNSIGSQGSRYQLLFGHRRVAAWQLYRPDEPIPLDVVEADDRVLFEHMAIENFQRRDLSAIEKATLLKTYIDQFGVTQEQAGKLLNLQSQGAVSNLLSLLRLPAGVQTHVERGDLPERVARAMVPLSVFAGDKLTKIAETVSQVAPEQKMASVERAIEHLLAKKGKRLNYAMGFDPSWNPAISVEIKGEAWTLRACKGCPFCHKAGMQEFCLKPGCFTAKQEQLGVQAAQALSKKTHIAVADADDIQAAPNWDVLIQDDRGQVALARAALKTKHTSLRLVPVKADANYMARHLRAAEVGSEWVALATTDRAQLVKDLKIKVPEKPAATPRDRENDRRAAYEQARALRDTTEKALSKMLYQIAPLFRPLMPSDPTVLILLFRVFEQSGLDSEAPGGNTKLFNAVRDGKAKVTDLQDALIAEALWVEADLAYELNPDAINSVIAHISANAKRCKVKLPAGWDEPLHAVFAVAPVSAQEDISPGLMAEHPIKVASGALKVKSVSAATPRSIGSSRPAPKPGKPGAKSKSTSSGRKASKK
jgi:ParB/RepB/Spo0J family partition protein